MQDVLTDLNQSVTGIQASAIFSVDGILLASTLPYNEDPDEIGAIVAAIQSLGGKTVGLLRRGSLQKIQVEGDKGTMIIAALGEAALLVVLTTRHANLGLLLHEAQRLQAKVAEEDWFVGESS